MGILLPYDSKILVVDIGAYKLQTQVADPISSNPNYLELRNPKSIGLQGNLRISMATITR